MLLKKLLNSHSGSTSDALGDTALFKDEHNFSMGSQIHSVYIKSKISGVYVR